METRRYIALLTGGGGGFLTALPEICASNVWFLGPFKGYACSYVFPGIGTIGLGVIVVSTFIFFYGRAKARFAAWRTKKDWQPNLMLPTALIALCTIGLCFAVLWYSTELQLVTTSSRGATASKPKPVLKKVQRFAKGQDVDFQALLFFEFPNTGYHSTERLELGQFANAPFATFFTMYPPGIRAEFYLVHIPKGANAFAVSKFVAENYETLREDQGPADSKVDRRIPEKLRQQLGIPNETRTHYIGEKVPFTGEIYVYHEPQLTKDQIGNLHDLFVKHGVVVTFRGPDHIAKMWADHGPRKD